MDRADDDRVVSKPSPKRRPDRLRRRLGGRKGYWRWQHGGWRQRSETIVSTTANTSVVTVTPTKVDGGRNQAQKWLAAMVESQNRFRKMAASQGQPIFRIGSPDNGESVWVVGGGNGDCG